jgi:hypothetical protein
MIYLLLKPLSRKWLLLLYEIYNLLSSHRSNTLKSSQLLLGEISYIIIVTIQCLKLRVPRLPKVPPY